MLFYLYNSPGHANIMYIQYGIITIEKKRQSAPGSLVYDDLACRRAK